VLVIMAAIYDALHFQPTLFATATLPQKLLTYECRETIGFLHILECIVAEGVDLSKQSWLTVHWRFVLGRRVAGLQGYLAHKKPHPPRTPR